MKLLLSLDLNLNILKLLFKSGFEHWLDLIETFLHLLKSFLLQQYSIIVFFKMLGQVIEIFKFLLVKNLVHLREDWSILLLQNILIHLQLLLTKHETLMLFINLINKCCN